MRIAAKPRGERLFAEPAGNLEDRVGLYWTSAQSLAALAPPKERSASKAAPSKRVKSVALSPALSGALRTQVFRQHPAEHREAGREPKRRHEPRLPQAEAAAANQGAGDEGGVEVGLKLRRRPRQVLSTSRPMPRSISAPTAPASYQVCR